MRDATEAPRNTTPSNPAADPAAGAPGYAALYESVALLDRRFGLLRLSGRNPRGMLNAILTNSVPEGPDTGAYALLLDPKGRIQADLRVLKSGDDLLVLTEPEGLAAAEEVLGRYAPFSRVELERLTDRTTVGLYGPRARDLLGAPELAEHATAELSVGGVSLLAVRVEVPVGGYDLILSSGGSEAVRRHLLSAGAVPAGPADYETARIAAGVPRFGGDLTPENFPGESSVLRRAVDFEKGCYPGQETVARMHYRGSPNKTLRLFAVDGPTPEPGEAILQGERRVGRITSVAPLAPDGETLALGYLARSADAAGRLAAAKADLRPR